MVNGRLSSCRAHQESQVGLLASALVIFAAATAPTRNNGSGHLGDAAAKPHRIQARPAVSIAAEMSSTVWTTFRRAGSARMAAAWEVVEAPFAAKLNAVARQVPGDRLIARKGAQHGSCLPIGAPKSRNELARG